MQICKFAKDANLMISFPYHDKPFEDGIQTYDDILSFEE